MAIFGLGRCCRWRCRWRRGYEAEGLSVAVVNPRFVKPMDAAVVERLGRTCGLIVTFEDHVLAGGFGSAVMETLNAAGLNDAGGAHWVAGCVHRAWAGGCAAGEVRDYGGAGDGAGGAVCGGDGAGAAGDCLNIFELASTVPLNIGTKWVSMQLRCASSRAAALLTLLCFSSGWTRLNASEQASVQATSATDTWTDAVTGLMWTASDNATDISWGGAVKYCRKLQLAGYADWRLPSVEQLEAIYDGSGFNAPHAPGAFLVLAGRARGGIRLSGVSREWSTDVVLDDRGHPTGYAWQFNFQHGTRWRENRGYKNFERVLCVRGA